MSIVRVVLLGVLVAASWTPLMAAAPDERYIIKFAPGAEEPVRGAIKQNRGQLKRALSHRRLLSATLPPGALKALQARIDVELVEVDPKRYPQAQSTPYGIPMVQAYDPDPAAQTGLQEASNSSRKVCIMDTGYDITHPDLPNNGITGDDDCGPGCGPSTDWDVDGYGHGTHVSGTIVGLNNGEGVVGVNGSGWLPVHMVKVFDDQGSWAYGSDIIKAIDQCVAAGAHVVNMSLGGPGSSTAEETAFLDAYTNSGVLFVAAAGNDGNNGLSYPASYDSVMSVAAIDDNKDAALFSQYNSQVEIAAPGVAVNSTLPGDTYAAWDGTSMATPHVTGVAALVWGHNENCSADQVRAALVAGAEDLGGPGRNSSYGYGLVQAMASNTLLMSSCVDHLPENDGYVVQELISPAAAVPIEATAGPIDATRGDEYHYSIEVPIGASDLRIMTYDADPGANGGTGDADLHVVAPGANTYPASDVWDCRPYINGSSETCVEDNPADGTWRIMLRAYTDFENVDVKASYTINGTPNDYHLPDADLPVAGTVSPSFADLSDNDGVMQTITEVSSGGKPKNRTSKAEHRWRIPGVTSGESVTLQLVAAGTDNGEGDSFVFDVSYDDGANWAPLCGSPTLNLREGGALQRYECDLPNYTYTTGTVLVRARDSDRTGGNLTNDILYVDQLQIVTVNPAEGPVEPPPPPPPDLVLSASGEKRKGKIWVTLDWTPASTVTIHRSINGAAATIIGSESGGTYPDNTGLKGSPVIDYYVCESPAPVPANCSDTVTVTF